MSEQHDGGPAYPTCDGYEREQDHGDRGYNDGEPRYVPINPRGGLTARQEYKKAAMQGLCANGGVLDRLAAAGQGDYPSDKSQALAAAENGLVTMAARFADAQLAEDAEHAKEGA